MNQISAHAIKVLRSFQILCGFLILSVASSGAQQITGAPGSPSGTISIDGNQLPPPPMKFGGKMERKLDNTLIIYIAGDNGNSSEGSLVGTPNEVASLQGVDVPPLYQLKYYPACGSDRTYPHMAVAWSWAFDTPVSWTKQIASHWGGVRQGTAISWPARIKDKGGIRNQLAHVIDIVPTILEATGIRAPEVVDGIPQKPIEGTSFVYTFDAKNANAPSRHHTQYFSR